MRWESRDCTRPKARVLTPRGSAGGAVGRRFTDHSLPRLLRRARAPARGAGAQPRVCGAGSHVSVPGSAPFAAGGRTCNRGTWGDAGVRARSVLVRTSAAAGPGGHACLARVLAHDGATAVSCAGPQRSDEESLFEADLGGGPRARAQPGGG